MKKLRFRDFTGCALKSWKKKRRNYPKSIKFALFLIDNPPLWTDSSCSEKQMKKAMQLMQKHDLKASYRSVAARVRRAPNQAVRMTHQGARVTHGVAKGFR
jgi:hypothetical protein